MTFSIFQIGVKEPVASVSCNPADFYPKVSRVANSHLNKAPVGTIILVKTGKQTHWIGKKRFKRIITG